MEADSTRKTIIPNDYKSSLPNDPQDVIHQISDSPRASEATNETNLSTQTTTKALFGRDYENLDGVILQILFSCSLKSMLNFRGVSQKFYELASSISSLFTNSSCSPLMHKACISFQYAQLNNVPELSLKEKFDFVTREKTEVHIKITVDELINQPLALQSIEDDQLKIILKIKNVNAINQLRNWISNPAMPKFVDKIQELDFREIIVNNNTCGPINGLLTVVAQNLPFFLSLTTFSFGAIKDNTTFTLSNPHPFDSITKLTVGKIDCLASFVLTDTFSNLIDLSIGNITASNPLAKNYEPIKLPLSLPRLRNLVIGDICAGAILRLPMLNQLVNLSVGKIDSNATLQLSALSNINALSIGGVEFNFLPPSFYNCKTLTIDSIDLPPNLPPSFDGFRMLSIGNVNYVALNLADSLYNLKNLTILDVKCNAILTLPSSLQDLTIKNICYNTTLTLADSFKNLKKLTIGTLNENATFNIPDGLPKLTNFSIKKMCDYACVTLPYTHSTLTFSIHAIHGTPTLKAATGLSNLINFSIGSMQRAHRGMFKSGTLTLPPLLDYITNLSIGKIGEDSTVELLGSMDSLKKLTIGSMENSGTLKLSSSLDTLTNLTIEDPSDMFLTLPISLKNLTSLSFEHIGEIAFALPDSLERISPLMNFHDGAYITLPKTLPNLRNLAIKWISESLELPDLFHNLTHITIGTIGTRGYLCKLTIPDSISHLTNITIGTFKQYSCVSLPTSLNSLTSLSIEKFSKKASLNIPNTMNNLTKLTVNKRQATLISVDGLKKFTIDTTIQDADFKKVAALKLLDLINTRMNPIDIPILERQEETCSIS